MNYRLIAMDMDGTLLDKQGNISEENRETLAECARRGCEIAFASGRSFESLRVFARALSHPTLLISCNGARADASAFGPMLFEAPIPEPEARAAYAILLASGAYFDCYSGGTVYLNNRQPIPGHSRAPHVDTLDGYVQSFVDDPQTLAREGLKRAYKFVAFSEDLERLARLRESLSALPLSLSSSWYTNVEVMRQGSGKGAALRAYCERKGIAREQVMAFGDNLNDLDMIEYAGMGVAMGNAVPELKRAARAVTIGHDESGVARAIKEYAL